MFDPVRIVCVFGLIAMAIWFWTHIAERVYTFLDFLFGWCKKANGGYDQTWANSFPALPSPCKFCGRTIQKGEKFGRYRQGEERLLHCWPRCKSTKDIITSTFPRQCDCCGVTLTEEKDAALLDLHEREIALAPPYKGHGWVCADPKLCESRRTQLAQALGYPDFEKGLQIVRDAHRSGHRTSLEQLRDKDEMVVTCRACGVNIKRIAAVKVEDSTEPMFVCLFSGACDNRRNEIWGKGQTEGLLSFFCNTNHDDGTRSNVRLKPDVDTELTGDISRVNEQINSGSLVYARNVQEKFAKALDSQYQYMDPYRLMSEAKLRTTKLSFGCFMWADPLTGAKFYYSDLAGENLHREDGPAIEYLDGSSIWCINGKKLDPQPMREVIDSRIIWQFRDSERRLHRTDGPAFIVLTDKGELVRKEWWVEGHYQKTVFAK